jgi:heat-inducible transcriptional repressor
LNEDLDERKQKILKAVVWSYVESAEPVGSENLAQRYADLGVKSATIRNTLAELADLGYLRQPHTSAGRVPSDRGYRFYVDHLMEERVPEPETLARTREELEAERAETLERVLRQACALLTRMTRYTSVATPPKSTTVIVRQVFAAPAGPTALLLVALLSTGESQHRMITGTPALLAQQDPAALTEAHNAINAAIAGRSLEELRAAGESPIPDGLTNPRARALYSALSQGILQIGRTVAEEADRAVVEGAGEIFRQPEFQDVAKLEAVLNALQTRVGVVDFISMALASGNATVVIGEENPIETMRECSVVTAYYHVGTRERGTLGIVGPTRMDYDRAVPAVNWVARSLSDILTRLA